MTKENLTEVIAVIDRSGSMGFLTESTIKGYNEFVKNQKKLEDDCNISLILFNEKAEYIYDNVPLTRVKKLTTKVYNPGGTTAMNDAIGLAINATGKRLSKMDECDRPSKVIVLIITDGHENSSTDYTTSQIREMIDIQQNTFSWEFIFLGANINVEQVSKEYGFKSGKYATYSADVKGTTALYTSVSNAVSNERGFTPDGSRGISPADITYDLQTEVTKTENS